MTKITLPHPSTGSYADGRLTGRVVMGTGAFIAGCGVIIAARDKDPVLGLISGIFGAVFGILGRDIYRVSDNLEKHYNASFTITGKVDSKKTAKAAFKGTHLEKTYVDIAALNTKNFTAVEVFLGAEPKNS